MKDNCNLKWEEIFANEDTHKEFISKTKSPIQLNIKNTTQDTSGQNIEMGISWRKTYRLWLGTWKHTQHHSFWQTGKSKVQWDVTSHWSRWPSQNTYKDKSPASAARLFTTSTTWEALFQYKKTMKVLEKVKKKESGAKRKAAALWPYW